MLFPVKRLGTRSVPLPFDTLEKVKFSRKAAKNAKITDKY